MSNTVILNKIRSCEVAPHLDAKYGPYNSLLEANALLGPDGPDGDVRCIGLTIGVLVRPGELKEYWYQSIDGVTEFVPKHEGDSYITDYDAENAVITIGEVEYQLTPVNSIPYRVGNSAIIAELMPGLDGFSSVPDGILFGESTKFLLPSNRTYESYYGGMEALHAINDVGRSDFYIMFEDNHPPKSGELFSADIHEYFSESDFMDPYKFNLNHDSVEYNGLTYKVIGIYGSFDLGDKFIINF
jgi:hypothetical protein